MQNYSSHIFILTFLKQKLSRVEDVAQLYLKIGGG